MDASVPHLADPELSAVARHLTVAIGASAGGLQALRALLQNMFNSLSRDVVRGVLDSSLMGPRTRLTILEA